MDFLDNIHDKEIKDYLQQQMQILEMGKLSKEEIRELALFISKQIKNCEQEKNEIIKKISLASSYINASVQYKKLDSDQ